MSYKEKCKKMKRTAAVMLLIILLAAGCADAEAGKPIFETTPAGVTAAPTPEPTPAPTPEPTPEHTPEPIPFSKYAPTVNMSFEELIGDDGDRSLPKGYPKAGTYKIIVDIAHQVTMVYKADESGEYRPERYMLCSTGVNGRTPKGTFKMGAYRVRFSKFARDGRYGQYARRFTFTPRCTPQRT